MQKNSADQGKSFAPKIIMESINEYLEGFEFQSNWRHIHWVRSIFVSAAKHRRTASILWEIGRDELLARAMKICLYPPSD